MRNVAYEKPMMSAEQGAGGGGPRTYSYKVCGKCGSKLHTNQRECQHCGLDLLDRNGAGHRLGLSTNPQDAWCEARLNNVDRCVRCELFKRGSPCKPAWYGGPCYGTERGIKNEAACAACKKAEPSRYECCQKVARKPDTAEGRRALIHKTFGLDPPRPPAALARDEQAAREKRNDDLRRQAATYGPGVPYKSFGRGASAGEEAPF